MSNLDWRIPFFLDIEKIWPYIGILGNYNFSLISCHSCLNGKGLATSESLRGRGVKTQGGGLGGGVTGQTGEVCGSGGLALEVGGGRVGWLSCVGVQLGELRWPDAIQHTITCARVWLSFRCCSAPLRPFNYSPLVGTSLVASLSALVSPVRGRKRALAYFLRLWCHWAWLRISRVSLFIFEVSGN